MERWNGRVALVTGASCGIGAAIAYQLQDAGMRVVAVARRVDKVESAVKKAREDAAQRGRVVRTECEPGTLQALKCDVSKEEDILNTFQWVKENLGGVDVLVNNAGVGGQTSLTETDTEDWRRQMDVNVVGLSICTREAIKQMRERGVDDGHIIHIGSRAGRDVPFVKGMEIYAATKHAVRVLTEGLRRELVSSKSKIRVTEIAPGAVMTSFADNLPKLMENISTSFRGQSINIEEIPFLNSEDVADSVLYVLGTPPHVQINEVIISPVGEPF